MLVSLRGSSSCGHVGMWPAVAMINHSCLPDALAYVIGDRMVRGGWRYCLGKGGDRGERSRWCAGHMGPKAVGSTASALKGQ